MSVNNFDVMKAMGEQNKDIRLAPMANILRLQKVKAGTQITIGVEGDVVGAIANGRFVGGLILADKAQFDETKRQLQAKAEGR
jgi:hypothetical protein